MEGSVCKPEIGGGLARNPCYKAMFGFFDHMRSCKKPQNLLGNVNSENANVCHRTRLLVVNGCPRDHNHSGSSKLLWKEAGPWHENPRLL
jgi:hypothetical protein